MSQQRKDGFKSANQAFKNFLEETGQDGLTKPQRDSLFKTWLDKVRSTGQIADLVPAFKDTVNNTESKAGNEPAATSPAVRKPFRPLGFHPLVAAAGAAAIIYGVIKLVQYVKKK
jgi:hypothetical protein